MGLFNYSHLPLRLKNVPAIPIYVFGSAQTLRKLIQRQKTVDLAKNGLAAHSYTINGETAPGYEFLFGAKAPESAPSASSMDVVSGAGADGAEAGEKSPEDQLLEHLETILREAEAELVSEFDTEVTPASDSPVLGEPEQSHDLGKEAWTAHLLDAVSEDDVKSFSADLQASRTSSVRSLTHLSLDHPDQFAIAWTTSKDVYAKAEPLLPNWSASLTDANEATNQFWPTMSQDSLAYNLLILQKVSSETIDSVRGRFDGAWTSAEDDLYEAGGLYAIDLTIFEMLEPHTTKGAERFTPSTFTLLKQDPQTKALTPFAVYVAGQNGGNKTLFRRDSATDGAWIYALQAAKVSATVYGIWLGHVYHWHIVTAAMQMTMYNTFHRSHSIYKLLKPTSDYLFGFDNILLALWGQAAPPASVNSSGEFLRLCDRFGEGRQYFDDDPTTTLAKFGIRQEDFSEKEPWDRYPVIRTNLRIWETVKEFAAAFVDNTYVNDKAVSDDEALQRWMEESRKSGNLHGLPTLNSRSALQRVLTSQIYRTTMHGISRMNSTANPALTFVANFPPTLQDSTIPNPSDNVSLQDIMRYMPKTGTIGEMVNFYFTFAFSAPYIPLIPQDDIDSTLYFGNDPKEPRNVALIKFRNQMVAFMKEYQTDDPQIHQWPRNIET